MKYQKLVRKALTSREDYNESEFPAFKFNSFHFDSFVILTLKNILIMLHAYSFLRCLHMRAHVCLCYDGFWVRRCSHICINHRVFCVFGIAKYCIKNTNMKRMWQEVHNIVIYEHNFFHCKFIFWMKLELAWLNTLVTRKFLQKLMPVTGDLLREWILKPPVFRCIWVNSDKDFLHLRNLQHVKSVFFPSVTPKKTPFILLVITYLYYLEIS